MRIGRFVVAITLLASAASAAGVDSTSRAAVAASPCRPSPTVPGATEGESKADTVAPSLGVLHAQVLLVYAADAAPESSSAGPTALLDAASDWYRSVSYGKLEFRGRTLERWLRLPASSAEYAADPVRYLRDSVAAADPYVDFSQVDVLYLVPSAETPVANPVSAVLNGFGVQADGRPIRAWVPFDPGFSAAEVPGLLLHETGHLLGLPDLYVAVARMTFHSWDLMTGSGLWPAELFAWHRWKLGWLEEAQIVCVTARTSRVVTLAPLERPGGRKAVFVRRGNHILALEVRARLGYDRTRCATGVLVYEVDQTQLRRAPIQLFTIRSDSRPPSANCGPKWNAPFGLARGQARELRLSTWGFRLQALGKLADGSYRVRVTTR